MDPGAALGLVGDDLVVAAVASEAELLLRTAINNVAKLGA